MPVFEASLVEMQPLDFLPQPIELKELEFPEAYLEAARLEAALDAPSVPGREANLPKPAPIRLRR
ncbi:MAG: hypothetical protein EA368_05440 [Leptolyngbya sp. DLM2.Bin27]|nr:MAG: hypothetical protein EA368_05440 [Leptolyngbya sp. DLM2.Bin27]